MDDEIISYYELLTTEHGSRWVELSRFLGFVSGRVEISQEDLKYWLLCQLDAGKFKDRIFAGSCYISLT